MKIIEEIKNTTVVDYYEYETGNLKICICDKNNPDIKLEKESVWEDSKIFGRA